MLQGAQGDNNLLLFKIKKNSPKFVKIVKQLRLGSVRKIFG